MAGVPACLAERLSGEQGSVAAPLAIRAELAWQEESLAVAGGGVSVW